MPLVRITHPPDCDAEAVSRAVHRALQAQFKVPADDYFHILEETGLGRRLMRPESYLGHRYSPAAVVIEITCSDTRDLAQKKALYADIAAGLEADLGMGSDDVIVVLTQNRPEDWCFGGGVAAYA